MSFDWLKYEIDKLTHSVGVSYAFSGGATFMAGYAMRVRVTE